MEAAITQNLSSEVSSASKYVLAGERRDRGVVAEGRREIDGLVSSGRNCCPEHRHCPCLQFFTLLHKAEKYAHRTIVRAPVRCRAASATELKLTDRNEHLGDRVSTWQHLRNDCKRRFRRACQEAGVRSMI